MYDGGNVITVRKDDGGSSCIYLWASPKDRLQQNAHFQVVVISSVFLRRFWRFSGGVEEAAGSWSAVGFSKRAFRRGQCGWDL